jgi:membrane protease YdiL (CAAX protease family)
MSTGSDSTLAAPTPGLPGLPTWPAPLTAPSSWPAPAHPAAAYPTPAAPWPAPSWPGPAGGRPSGRLLDHKAAVLVAAAIGVGGVVQLISLVLAHRSTIEPEALIRYDLLLTIGLYAAVAVMMASQITPSVRLQWGDGSRLLRVGIGLGCGAGLSLTLLALVSAAAGHLQPDPRIVALMSEGDATHIFVTVLITCVAAPIIEETLFRGLLLESLRPRGTALAVLVSAGAFAVWHFMPSSLIYYAALGTALGGLYLTRGLACSMAAHFGFNAVLTIAAISIVTGPSHVVTYEGLSLTTPGGWSEPAVRPAGPPSSDLLLVGPSDAELAVAETGPAIQGFSAASVTRSLQDTQLPIAAAVPDIEGVTQRTVTGGLVVEVPLKLGNRPATLAIVDGHDASYQVIFDAAGSTKAASDFDKMMSSLAVQ